MIRFVSVAALSDEAPSLIASHPKGRCCNTGDASRLGAFAFPGPVQSREGITSRTVALDWPQECSQAAAWANHRAREGKACGRRLVTTTDANGARNVK